MVMGALERDSPHAVHIRGAGGTAQPGSQALLWGLAVHIVGGQEETAGEQGKRGEIRARRRAF